MMPSDPLSMGMVAARASLRTIPAKRSACSNEKALLRSDASAAGFQYGESAPSAVAVAAPPMAMARGPIPTARKSPAKYDAASAVPAIHAASAHAHAIRGMGDRPTMVRLSVIRSEPGTSGASVRYAFAGRGTPVGARRPSDQRRRVVYTMRCRMKRMKATGVPPMAFEVVVGDTGFEPVTSCMSSKRSNQLS